MHSKFYSKSYLAMLIGDVYNVPSDLQQDKGTSHIMLAVITCHTCREYYPVLVHEDHMHSVHLCTMMSKTCCRKERSCHTATGNTLWSRHWHYVVFIVATLHAEA